MFMPMSVILKCGICGFNVHGNGYILKTRTRRQFGDSMGATPIETGEPEKPITDKDEQTHVHPSNQSCIDVVAELKAAQPTGKPLMSIVAPGQDADLSHILFKQENEHGGDPNAPVEDGYYGLGDMRPGIYGQRSQWQAERQDTTEEASFAPKPDYFDDMKEVFGNSKYFDMVRNHNQVLSTAEHRTMTDVMDGVNAAQLQSATEAIQEKPNEPTTLLNFDSHSDMWMGPVRDGKESIAQWVNAVLKQNPNVNEVYWVIPKDFKEDAKLKAAYFDHTGATPNGDRVFVHAEPDVKLYLNNDNGELSPTKPDDYSDSKYRTIDLHKRTLEDLPDFKGKRTAVSIDLDFFDNRGYDTAYGAAVKFAGDEGFRSLVETMKEKGLRPEYTTVSASPEYVRSEHVRDLMRFGSLVSDSMTAEMDAVVVPAQNEVYGTFPHSGIQVDRKGVPALELTHELFKSDAETTKPDDALDIQVQSDELNAAFKTAKAIYHTNSDQESMQVLTKLDAMDGNQNGVLEFEAIEGLVVRVCKDGADERLVKNPDGED
jgi:hypothetical protein